ncbi:hypothetical protein LG943_22775 [Streptomonospora sp. S1-112]|uniref:Uncharacterized protein n=1 Tax=Streptomonospora mangrovi TaxID=2883123 RepID=A0A9X3SHH1_9ACTN|nr:hypothetical protein [Streptomonospora mangrovi]MDA0567120.1 hypothetical protein [Streptomonospora mangrovi]
MGIQQRMFGEGASGPQVVLDPDAAQGAERAAGARAAGTDSQAAPAVPPAAVEAVTGVEVDPAAPVWEWAVPGLDQARFTAV